MMDAQNKENIIGDDFGIWIKYNSSNDTNTNTKTDVK